MHRLRRAGAQILIFIMIAVFARLCTKYITLKIEYRNLQVISLDILRRHFEIVIFFHDNYFFFSALILFFHIYIFVRFLLFLYKIFQLILVFLAAVFDSFFLLLEIDADPLVSFLVDVLCQF